MIAPRFWSPQSRATRKASVDSFSSSGLAASAINRIAVPYLFPIDAANDRDHCAW